MPLPSEETTPPVTKMNLAIHHPTAHNGPFGLCAHHPIAHNGPFGLRARNLIARNGPFGSGANLCIGDVFPADRGASRPDHCLNALEIRGCIDSEGLI